MGNGPQPIKDLNEDGPQPIEDLSGEVGSVGRTVPSTQREQPIKNLSEDGLQPNNDTMSMQQQPWKGLPASQPASQPAMGASNKSYDVDAATALVVPAGQPASQPASQPAMATSNR